MLFGPPSRHPVETSPHWLSARIERRHILRGLLIITVLLLLAALIYRRVILPPRSIHNWRM